MSKLKKYLKATVGALAFLCLCSLVQLNVHAQDSGQYVNQWVQEGDSWYYYDNSGQKIINNFVELNGKWYYFDENGVSQRHKWLAFDNGETWCWFDDTGARCFGFTEIDGKMRYVGDKGAIINNFVFENGKWYYFDGDGVLQTHKWLAFDNGETWCWFDDTGARCFGFTEIDGKMRYVGEKGAIINNFVFENGKWYYFDGDGVLQTHKWLAFDNGETWCWFDDTGARCFGFTEIDGEMRYVGEKGAIINNFVFENGKWYYFDGDGVLQTHKWLAFDNGETWCWFDDTGARCLGWTEIDGRTYYINENGAVKNGSVRDNGKLYYLDASGEKAVNGWHYINGYKYYFDKDGTLVENVDSIIGKQSSYYLTVNTHTNTVTVFAKDGANGYIIPVKKMICSTGLPATPTIKGTFTLRRAGRWYTLMGPVYGQYVTQISGPYFFHSAWYHVNGNIRSLSVSEYRKLGNNASHGCVRLTVVDAKWIYENCNGSTVYIYNGSDTVLFAKPARPNPVVISGDWGYDPTDPAIR